MKLEILDFSPDDEIKPVGFEPFGCLFLKAYHSEIGHGGKRGYGYRVPGSGYRIAGSGYRVAGAG